MKKMSPPELNSQKIYKDIKKNSRDDDKKSRLERLEGEVLQSYKVYEENYETLENLSTSIIADKYDKEALESCYNRNKDGYLEGKVVALIISRQSPQHKDVCPMCGMDKPRTIDHYLPKSLFPEYSAFPPNLIPCCYYCNGKKGDIWKVDGKRLYVNMYYDKIQEDKRFLFTSLMFSDDQSDYVPIIEFSLNNIDGIDTNLYDIITTHYKKLNLLMEYSGSVGTVISHIYDLIYHDQDTPMSEHINNLRKNRDTFVRCFGINYWRASLYSALIESEEFFKRISLKVAVDIEANKQGVIYK